MTNQQIDEGTNDLEKVRKIEALRDMINNAEKTIQSAKAMLLQLEGKKKTGRKRKLDEDEDGGTVIQGTFDGQIMLGTDNKQYPVPANYASKSKLVEGDMLKLTITPDGSFIYKQIGPIERRHAIGIVSQDEKGNFFVFSEGKPHKVLLASVTYFKAEPGDEVTITLPRDIDSSWAAIETVLQKGGSMLDMTSQNPHQKPQARDGGFDGWKKDIQEDATPAQTPAASEPPKGALGDLEDNSLDDWASDVSDLEKEILAQ